jgi:hypothetical protein
MLNKIHTGLCSFGLCTIMVLAMPAFANASETWNGQFDGGTMAVTIETLNVNHARVQIVGTGHSTPNGMRRCDFTVGGIASIQGETTTLHVDDGGTPIGTNYVFTRTGKNIEFTSNLDLYRSSCTYRATLTPGKATQAPATPSRGSLTSLVGPMNQDGIAIYKGTFQARAPYSIQIGFRELPDGTINVATMQAGGQPEFAVGRQSGNSVKIDRLGPFECHFAFNFSDQGRTVDAVPSPRCNDNPDFVGGRLSRVK